MFDSSALNTVGGGWESWIRLRPRHRHRAAETGDRWIIKTVVFGNGYDLIAYAAIRASGPECCIARSIINRRFTSETRDLSVEPGDSPGARSRPDRQNRPPTRRLLRVDPEGGWEANGLCLRPTHMKGTHYRFIVLGDFLSSVLKLEWNNKYFGFSENVNYVIRRIILRYTGFSHSIFLIGNVCF